jgi:hypothetical protein
MYCLKRQNQASSEYVSLLARKDKAKKLYKTCHIEIPELLYIDNHIDTHIKTKKAGAHNENIGYSEIVY